MKAEYSAEQIRQRVQQAGIVGAGGAGFPTHVKLQANAEIYLVNGAECEPLLKVDQQLAAHEAATLVRGLGYAMQATGAKEGIIALKEKYQPAIEQLTPLLPATMRLHILPDIYPAGDEVITIWLSTGRRVPPASLPLSVGVVVSNVQSLINVAKAVEHDTPVTQRTLTVNGAVKQPITVTVPLGTSLREVLALAGGVTISNPAYINGGPMMGKETELDQPVTKTTGGLLVLPEDHLLIRRRRRSMQTVMAIAQTVCEQCCLCTELCPRHLIGHELPPHLIVRAVNYQHAAKPSVLLAALTCSECGVCEAYACPVDISPMRVNQALKKQFQTEGARYQGELRLADPMAKYRMLPIKRLISRLNLSDFNQSAPLSEQPWQPASVTIPLRQHIGVAAIAVVKAGDRVKCGQLIAEIPADKLGAPVHASIDGRITQIDQNSICITQEG